MTKEYQLGRLEKVDLRKVWANEARDFTPWLAREENISLLSEAIGIELEVEDTEKGVGSFSADILCREANSARSVLIENQFNKTEYAHLGKLVTNAAGLDAVTIIWISSNIRDEHRAALDWLNDNTTRNIKFLGIEIELYRIGNSPIAPDFKIVSQPDERTETTRQESDLSTVRLEYWTVFCDLVEQRGEFKPAKPRDNWIRNSILSNFKLDMGNDSIRKTIHINVVITGSNSKEKLRKLEQDKFIIEQEVNDKLDWRSGTIYLKRYNSDIKDKDSWAEQHEWLYEKLQLFHKVFTNRIKSL